MTNAPIRTGVVLASVLSATTFAYADNGWGHRDAITATTSEINQNTSNDKSEVANFGTITGSGDVGTGASAGVSATGAVSSVSVSNVAIKSEPISVKIEHITQTSTNTDSPITNYAVIDMRSYGAAGGLTGDGASAAASATGAAASIGFSNIDSHAGFSDSIGHHGRRETSAINQTATNWASAIGNYGDITVGSLSGDASSVTISAAGAVATLSFSNVDSSATKIAVGDITQRATNGASSIYNHGAINVGDLTGTGASASIGATGAASSVSVGNIKSPIGNVALGDITQTTKNLHSTVTNIGAITLGSLAGTGASASISAVGAASVVSFSNIGAAGHVSR